MLSPNSSPEVIRLRDRFRTLHREHVKESRYPSGSSTSSLKCWVSQRLKTQNSELFQIFSTQQISLDVLVGWVER
jgi:hypothetical protein